MGGMFVTIKAVMYQAAGEECHVNKTNSVLGLAMYASYFVLFFKLFVDNYYLKPKTATALPQKRPTMREVARSVSRKMTQAIEDEGEDAGHDRWSRTARLACWRSCRPLQGHSGSTSPQGRCNCTEPLCNGMLLVQLYSAWKPFPQMPRRAAYRARLYSLRLLA